MITQEGDLLNGETAEGASRRHVYTNKKVGDVTISAEEMANYRHLQEMEEQLAQKQLKPN
jgi:hypothetical protein